MNDWAGTWMDELAACKLPGPDFVVLAPNVSLDKWLNRPARYADFIRALHLLLMLHGGETPSSVVEFTPHGCRHVQVTPATQMASQGLLTESSLESLGHWEKGSKMPRHYDSAACVTELHTRKRSPMYYVPDGGLQPTVTYRALQPLRANASHVQARPLKVRRSQLQRN